MITVVNKRTYKGKGIYIGRPSILGNPFLVGVHGTRQECVDQYAAKMATWYCRCSEYQEAILAIYDQHKAHKKVVLICWCAPLACHGDAIKAFVEGMKDPCSS